MSSIDMVLGRCFRGYMMHNQVPNFAKIHSHMYTHGNLGGSCGNRPGLMATGLLFASQATTTLSHRPFLQAHQPKSPDRQGSAVSSPRPSVSRAE